MPVKVRFGPPEFEEFRTKMLALRFRETGGNEVYFDIQRLGLEAPRKSPGRQTGFLFYANGYKVQVWTTYVESEEGIKESANGWVLMKIRDRVDYFTHPLRRTENFLEKLLCYAKVCQERIVHRPICPECRRGMEIVYGPAFGSRFWRCPYTKHIGKAPRESFDFGISEESRNFLKPERKIKANYRELANFHKLFLEEGGMEYIPARIRRGTWKITRPENRE